jgi:membrane associated rhomboid family serine protease
MALGSKEVLPGADPWQAAPPPARRPVRSPVCWGLIVVSVGLFVAQSLGAPLVAQGALYGPAVSDGEWWRVLSGALLHGGPLHLVFNLSVVWTLGRGLEHAIGSGRFALVSLAGAAGSAAFILLFDYPHRTVGLSGVILGWAGVALPMLDRQGRREIWVWLAQVVLISLLPGVSWAGHLGGFLAGGASGLGLRHSRTTFARTLPVVAFIAGVLVLVALWRHQA